MSSIESVAHESRVFPPSPAFVSQANIKPADFDRLAQSMVCWRELLGAF